MLSTVSGPLPTQQLLVEAVLPVSYYHSGHYILNSFYALASVIADFYLFKNAQLYIYLCVCRSIWPLCVGILGNRRRH